MRAALAFSANVLDVDVLRDRILQIRTTFENVQNLNSNTGAVNINYNCIV